MKLKNTHNIKKAELIKEFMCENIDKPPISSFDLFQRISWIVELLIGNKVVKVMTDCEQNPSIIELTNKELYECAFISLAKVIPIDLLNEYIDELTSELFKKINGYFPEFVKEFNSHCMQIEKLKVFQSKILN